MPGFDGSGPMGRGPMTGGGFGNCGGRTDYRGGYGMGYGMGRGRGFRGGGRGGVARFGGAGWGYYPADYQDPQYERASLQSLTDQLRAELAALERRMGELEQRET